MAQVPLYVETVFHVVDVHPCIAEGDPGLDGGHPDDSCFGDVAFDSRALR